MATQPAKRTRRASAQQTTLSANADGDFEPDAQMVDDDGDGDVSDVAPDQAWEAAGEDDEDFDDEGRPVRTGAAKRASSAIAGPSAAAAATGDYRAVMQLKPDHVSRPLWVCPDGQVFLETFSPVYKQAYDFLIAIAEPISRPALMHEYKLTPYSLYAAAALGLKTEDILSVLNKLCKCALPEAIVRNIREWTMSYGKVKLVLQRNRYYLESAYPDILKKLARDPELRALRVGADSDAFSEATVSTAPLQIPGGGALADEQAQYVDKIMADAGEGEEKLEGVQRFEVQADKVVNVKRRCIELDFPVLEEYDFRNDPLNPTLSIDLKPTTSIRSYQEKSLSKMFANGRARSGIIVLPCGSGKTLVGITAACTIKKSVLVLCTSGVSVEQWRQQFKLWSDIDDSRITRFTSDQKEKLPEGACVTITTYTMVAYGGKRSADALKLMEGLASREWGMLLLDEVHVVPAHMFRKVLDKTQAHCKLGLTATLVREDDKIENLNYLIGPKLYEANWLDLQASGHIARVQCAEVWCAMTPEFYAEYLRTDSQSRKRLLYALNPNKLRACKFLIDYHEQRGDKTIVFADNLYALETYARLFGKLYLHGAHSSTERMQVLANFQHNPAVKTIFISKVGDTSIDLPEATVIIQISSHFGSRRQEAQRLGRILRPKPRSEEQHNAFFYTLVSQDTSEMVFGTKRQQFLISQGYSFKVITDLPLPTPFLLDTKAEQLELLTRVLALEGDGVEKLEDDADDITGLRKVKPGATAATRAQRRPGSAAAISGGADREYSEVRNEPSTVYQRAPVRHPLFAKRARDAKEKKKQAAAEMAEAAATAANPLMNLPPPPSMRRDYTQMGYSTAPLPADFLRAVRRNQETKQT